jgi:hypothetical protein
MQAQAILFDMDGTLLNSIAVIERLWKEWAARHDLSLNKILAVAHGRPTIETMRLPPTTADRLMTPTTRASAGRRFIIYRSRRPFCEGQNGETPYIAFHRTLDCRLVLGTGHSRVAFRHVGGGRLGRDAVRHRSGNIRMAFETAERALSDALPHPCSGSRSAPSSPRQHDGESAGRPTSRRRIRSGRECVLPLSPVEPAWI